MEITTPIQDFCEKWSGQDRLRYDLDEFLSIAKTIFNGRNFDMDEIAEIYDEFKDDPFFDDGFGPATLGDLRLYEGHEDAEVFSIWAFVIGHQMQEQLENAMAEKTPMGFLAFMMAKKRGFLELHHRTDWGTKAYNDYIAEHSDNSDVV